MRTNESVPVGTQAPQSRAVNFFSKETTAWPYRPTWLLHVTGHVQCTEVTLSCSCLDQHTRVLIQRLGLNEFTLSVSKTHASCTVSSFETSLALFIFTLKLSGFLFSQKSKLSLINNQRYDFSPLIALYF